MYNKVVMVGNLTRDIELRYMPNGDGDTLKEAEPEEVSLLGFSTLNLTV